MRFVPALLLAAVLLAALSAVALATSSRASPLTAADDMTIAGETATLRQAYVYLEASDHDYHGHRVRALKAVGAACRALGFHAKGDAKNHENQQFSDNLMGSARNLLTNVLPHARSTHQDEVVGHIEHALREIDLALAGDKGPSKSKTHSPGTGS